PKRGSSREKRKARRSRRKWATRATHGTMRARPWNMCGRAPSARFAKSMSGRTVRSAIGRKAFRVPKCGRRRPPASAGIGPGLEARLATTMAGSYPKPDGLAWDLFLGPAPAVDYHPVYHPFNWRGWVDWGVGAIGDMGAHLIDHSMWALDLGFPTSVETVSTPFNGVCHPHATMTFYEFPAR